MINKNEKQIELEFGKGDICITGGYFKNEKNEKVGLVTFIEQEPREIGAVGITTPDQEYKVGDFPVIIPKTGCRHTGVPDAHAWVQRGGFCENSEL